MKRILFSLMLSLLSLQLFSQTKNIIFRETFPTDNISEVKIISSSGEIVITGYHGEEILVEIDSNTKFFLPDISISKNTFKIENKTKINKGDHCTIFIYIPFSTKIENYFLKNKTGVHLQNITSTETISLFYEEGTSKFSDVISNYLSVEGNNTCLDINNSVFTYFDIQMLTGKINLNFSSAPLAQSLCSIKDGPITISLPRTENFEIVAHTNKGDFINNFIKTVQTANTSRSFKNGQDGAVLHLQSFSGNITLNP